MRKWAGFNIMVVVCGALLFGLSIHGIDLAVNYIHLNNELGLKLVDKAPFGVYQTPEQIYIQSLAMLIISFVMTIAGVINSCRSLSEESIQKPRSLGMRR